MPTSLVKALPSADGVERMQAFFAGLAFTPHSHDTYAVGITQVGVQSFDYRGETRSSLPRQAFVLHPDERHDGRQGDTCGFGYRIAYIDPALVRAAAPCRSLPFVTDPVQTDGPLYRAVADILSVDSGDDLGTTDSLSALADALWRISGQARTSGTQVDECAIARARELLLECACERITLADLERATGLSRWQLARQFRRAYGVSPSRFQILRRLDVVRAELRRGAALATAAIDAGFIDQAHMTRQFRRAYGISPGRWRSLTTALS